MAEGPKGRLALVGLGLYDETDITARGLEEIREADIVFSESYTSRLSEGSLSRLSEKLGREIRVLDREEVEDA